MRVKVIGLFAIGNKGEPTPGIEPDWGVEMPIGGEILGVGYAPQQGGMPGLAAIVAHAPNRARVWVPLHIGMFGMAMTPKIGRQVGKFIGVANEPTTGTPTFVFHDEQATPESAVSLIIGEAQGNG